MMGKKEVRDLEDMMGPRRPASQARLVAKIAPRALTDDRSHSTMNQLGVSTVYVA